MKSVLDPFAEAVRQVGNAMAQIVDEDIIYGCNDNALRWHKRLMQSEIRKFKPRWIPSFLWERIFKAI